uniref:(northern house mosquito) hypothetical protein n=1 Tax=Culex pipiens TaxID=7175 RepID=A0A8D8FN84_CULPI
MERVEPERPSRKRPTGSAGHRSACRVRRRLGTEIASIGWTAARSWWPFNSFGIPCRTTSQSQLVFAVCYIQLMEWQLSIYLQHSRNGIHVCFAIVDYHLLICFYLHGNF